MKSFQAIFFISFMSLTFSSAFAKGKDEVLCLQKESPVVAEFYKTSTDSQIKLKFLKNLQSFKVVNVRGLDGLVVSYFDGLSLEIAKLDKEEIISIGLDGESGLQYIVIDFQFKENNQTQSSSATVAVGKISKAQINERAINIKTIGTDGTNQTQSGQQSKGLSKKKIHLMKIE